MASDPLKSYFEKKAGAFGDAFKSTFSAKNVANHAVGSAGAALGGAAIAGMGMGAHALYDAVTKAHDFKNMLAENPDVQQMHADNPRELNRMFSTLRTYTPEFTKDPMVAGAYMRQMMDSPNGVNGFMTSAIDSRRKLLGNSPDQGKPFTHAVANAAAGAKPANPLGPRQSALEEGELGHQEYTAGPRRLHEQTELAKKFR